MTDYFYWTGDGESSSEPPWLVEGLTSGAVVVENGGTANVCLIIKGKRFPRFSRITRRDVEPGLPVHSMT